MIWLILILIKIQMKKNQRKNIRENRAKNLEYDKSETDERDQSKRPELLERIDSQKIGDDDDPVATDIDLESNVMKNTELSTSDSVARQLTENPDDMVDAEEEISSEDLTITGDYSDYDILE